MRKLIVEDLCVVDDDLLGQVSLHATVSGGRTAQQRLIEARAGESPAVELGLKEAAATPQGSQNLVHEGLRQEHVPGKEQHRTGMCESASIAGW